MERLSSQDKAPKIRTLASDVARITDTKEAEAENTQPKEEKPVVEVSIPQEKIKEEPKKQEKKPKRSFFKRAKKEKPKQKPVSVTPPKKPASVSVAKKPLVSYSKPEKQAATSASFTLNRVSRKPAAPENPFSQFKKSFSNFLSNFINQQNTLPKVQIPTSVLGNNQTEAPTHVRTYQKDIDSFQQPKSEETGKLLDATPAPQQPKAEESAPSRKTPEPVASPEPEVAPEPVQEAPPPPPPEPVVEAPAPEPVPVVETPPVQPVSQESPSVLPETYSQPETSDEYSAEHESIVAAQQAQEQALAQPLRTFGEDTINYTRTAPAQQQREVREGTTSLLERKRQEQEQAVAKKANKKQLIEGVGIIVGGLLLIATGITLSVFLYRQTPEAPVIREDVPSFVKTDTAENILLDVFDRSALLGALEVRRQDNQARSGSITQLHLVQPAGEDGSVSPVSSFVFLNTLGVRAPDSFIRNLRSDFILGIHKKDGDHPLLVFKTNLYSSAFAGMLEWERYMSTDLDPLFGPAVIQATDVFGSQTTDITFLDTVIDNRDVRVLKDELGDEVLMYTFVDQQTIIITTNRETLREALDRF